MRVILFFALLALVCGAVAADPLFRDFQDWTRRFDKTYDSPEEMLIRFANFVASEERIAALREEHAKVGTVEEAQEVYAHTMFSDLSAEEFRQQYLTYKPARTGPVTSVVAGSMAEDDLPTKINWADKGVVTAVGNQGSCGDCWAWSATEAVESAWAMAGNKLEKLSVQQLTSCSDQNGGCNGGDLPPAFDYIQKKGLETDAAYPFTSGDGNTGQCQADGSSVVSISNYSYATTPCYDNCDNQSEKDMQKTLVQNGPLAICVDAESWQYYSGGVIRNGCPHAYSDLDHCVQATGYNAEGNLPYWIVRNSWTTSWGLDGYLHIEMNKNLCGLADEAMWVVARKF